MSDASGNNDLIIENPIHSTVLATILSAKSHAENYVTTHNDACKDQKDAFCISEDTIPAYTFLADTWGDWVRRHPESYDLSTPKKVEKLLTGTFTPMLEGLTNYFEHARDVQEELVEITAQASWKSIVARGLLTSLYTNREITSEDTLKNAVQTTLNILMPRKRHTIPVLPDSLLNLVQATHNIDKENKDTTNPELLALRKGIEDWVLEAFEAPSLEGYKSSIKTFRESRRSMFEAANNYEQRLENAIRATEELASLYRRRKETTDTEISQLEKEIVPIVSNIYGDGETTRDSLPNLTKEESDELAGLNKKKQALEAQNRAYDSEYSDIKGEHGLQELLRSRLDAVEALRAGAIHKLPPQGKDLDSWPLLSLAGKDMPEALKPFLRSTEKDNTPPAVHFHIDDLPGHLRDLKSPSHPLVGQLLAPMQEGLEMLMDSTRNTSAALRADFPAVGIKESGTKSWRRAIEKLVTKKNGEWSGLGDLCRISTSFEQADDMFFFNRALCHTVAHSNGWKAKGWKVKKDDGLNLKANGYMSWHMGLERDIGDGKAPFRAEVQLNEAALSGADPISHLLYRELRRLKELSDNKNFDRLTGKDFDSAIDRTSRTITAILNHGNPPEAAEKYLDEAWTKALSVIHSILETGREKSKQHALNDLYRAVKDAHLACYSAVIQDREQTHSSMRALYKHLLKEELKRIPVKIAKKTAEPDYGPSAKITEIYEQCDPHSYRDEPSFTEADTAHVKQLIGAWKQHAGKAEKLEKIR